MNKANTLLESGVTLADPARVDVRGELTCGRDVVIDVNCIFEGKVSLGDRVRVGANCILRDVSIGADTEVKPFSLLEEATIGRDARIGPYARIRPGTELADEVHIGNFVEVKASRIAARSKANHLAYVGDSTVGSDVNIGAGTITCNYDGVAKHETILGAGVFVGSDTQLVAPVTVGDGAFIAAGSTITEDVPAGALALSRTPQQTKEGWAERRKKVLEGLKKG
jgi:bifunctional UDP-N-acetylglucosamine pyrophosphorylase/glucosamine-1-phosphate N-acetyltransferase